MARILQVCNADFTLAKFLLPLVLKLADAGHTVECICEGSNIPAEITARGIVVHPFEFPRRGDPLQFLAGIQRMRGIVRRGRYDCVNSHNRNASIIARVAAWLEKTPLSIYTARGFYFHDDQGAIAHEVTVWLEALLARITDFTLSQSREDVDYVVHRGIISREKIEWIGNGISTSRFTPVWERRAVETELGFRENCFRIGATGRLVQGKGFIDLLDAFAEFNQTVPNAELLLIGGNIAQDIHPFQRQFLDRVDKLGLQQRVVVTGVTDCVEKHLAVCDIFVLPSYREGVPRSLLEAMSMGLPCIATDIRGAREIIKHGEEGLLFQPKDVPTLARLIDRLCRDSELRTRIARNARALAIAQYDEAGYLQKQVSAIERFLPRAQA